MIIGVRVIIITPVNKMARKRKYEFAEPYEKGGIIK